MLGHPRVIPDWRGPSAVCSRFASISGFPLWPFVSSVVKVFGFSRLFSPPTRPFLQPHSKQSTYPIPPLRDPGVALGRRLGDPRVTLGSPKPNPSRQRVAGGGRYGLPELLKANCQRASNYGLSSLGENNLLYYFFAFLSS